MLSPSLCSIAMYQFKVLTMETRRVFYYSSDGRRCILNVALKYYVHTRVSTGTFDAVL